MSSLIPFEGKQLPSYLTAANAAAINSDLTSHAGAGFPVISIKGKVFATVRNGEREIIKNPKDETAAAHYIDVVLVKANKYNSKIFYLKKYTEGDGGKPDCYSNDSITPAADAQSPQAAKCAVCKHNQWGSRITESGEKGKACNDNARLAVSMPNMLNDPYLIRVPPASLRALADYGSMLAKRGVPYQGVVTRLIMDAESATPKLKFEPVGLLPQDQYEQSVAVGASEVALQIIGGGAVYDDTTPVPQITESISKNKAVSPEEVAVAVAVAATPTKAAAPKKADPEVEIDLDNLSFDD